MLRDDIEGGVGGTKFLSTSWRLRISFDYKRIRNPLDIDFILSILYLLNNTYFTYFLFISISRLTHIFDSKFNSSKFISLINFLRSLASSPPFLVPGCSTDHVQRSQPARLTNRDYVHPRELPPIRGPDHKPCNNWPIIRSPRVNKNVTICSFLSGMATRPTNKIPGVDRSPILVRYRPRNQQTTRESRLLHRHQRSPPLYL